MDKTTREDSESPDPKQGEADFTIREEGAEVQGTDETLVEGASTGDDLVLTRGMKVPEGVGPVVEGVADEGRREALGRGSRDVRVYYEGDVEQEHKRNYQPYRLRGKEIYEPKELAVYLGENREEGLKHFGRGFITDWVKGELKDQGLASDLTDITEDGELDGEQKLSAVLLLINQELPLMWKGEMVTRERPRPYGPPLWGRVQLRNGIRNRWPQGCHNTELGLFQLEKADPWSENEGRCTYPVMPLCKN